MVRIDDSDQARQEAERKRLIEEAKKNPKPSINKADAYVRGIFGIISGNEQILTAAIKGSNEDFLEVSSKMSNAELAGDIAFFVAFSLAGRVGNKLGKLNSKGGKTTSFDRVSKYAKSKGFKLAPDIKAKVNAEINRVNQLGDSKQQEGILRIRESKLSAAKDLLKNITDKTERFKLKADIEGIKRSITQGAKDLADAKLKEEVESINKLDPNIQFKIENGKIVKALSEQEKAINAKGEEALQKTKLKNEAIIDENIRQATKLVEEANRREQLAKEAREKAKAEDKAIDEDPDFDEKGEPDGDKVIETKEKTDVKDKPDFSDPVDEGKAEGKAEGKEKTDTELIDEAIDRAEAKEKTDTITGKVAGAATAGAVTTNALVNALTNDEQPTRRRNFELDDEPAFTNEPVKEGEPETQPTNAPTPAPSPAPAPAEPEPSNEESDTIGFNPTLIDVKQTIDVENIDDLFVRTLEFCEIVYELDSFENGKYYKTIDIPGKRFILREYNFPVLFNISEGTLFIVFRGTSGARTYQEGVSNFLTDLSTKKRVEDFLNKISSYENLSEHLPEKIAEIECHYGFLKDLDIMYNDMKSKIAKLKNIKHIIVSGHSAGGALASLFSLIYSYDESIDDKKDIDFVITYGSPRWLFDNIEYKQLYDDALPNSIRVWNQQDAVTYVPFHKPPALPTFTDTISGFIHTGQSFCLDAEYLNQNLNLLIENMIKNDNGQILNIVKKLNPNLTNALMNYVISEDFQNVISGGLLECMRNSYIKPEVTSETIKVYNERFRENFKEIESYADKCLELEPFHLMDLALNSNLKDTDDLQDIGLMSIFGLTYNFFNTSAKAHFPPHYKKLLNELISEQEKTNKDIISSKKDLLDDFKEEETKEELPQIDQIDASYIITTEKILGYTESEFQSGNIVEF